MNATLIRPLLPLLLRGAAHERVAVPDRGDVGVRRQAHLAALEVNGNRGGTGTGGGPCHGLYAAVAVHAGDLQDQFFSHVI